MKKLVALLALTVALSAPAWAATKTVTLSVPSMTCATCPITVKKALTKVEGVIEASRVEIDPSARLKGRLVMPLNLPRGLKVPTPTRDPWAS